MRSFTIKDSIALGHLHELALLAGEDCREGDLHLVDILIRAVIGTFEVMPKEITARIRTSGFYVGDTHERMNNQQRVRLWARLSGHLNEDLDRLAADATLAEVDVSKRPKTKGEAILEVCERLETARRQNTDMLPLARVLEREGAGTDAGYDGSKLIKLLSKKRIDDLSRHDAEVCRLIYHAQIVGGQFHNQRAHW